MKSILIKLETGYFYFMNCNALSIETSHAFQEARKEAVCEKYNSRRKIAWEIKNKVIFP